MYHENVWIKTEKERIKNNGLNLYWLYMSHKNVLLSRKYLLLFTLIFIWKENWSLKVKRESLREWNFTQDKKIHLWKIFRFKWIRK